MEPTVDARRLAQWDGEDLDVDGSAQGLLESGEQSCEEVVERPSAPSRSLGRISAATLLSAAALACVLGLSGAAASARDHLGWGAVSAGLSSKQAVNSAGTLDQQMYGTTAAPTPSPLRYGQQIFDANAKSLAPKENKNDGNLCGDDEEEFAKACYKKCALLTENKYPFRTSPFSCCESDPCPMSKQQLKVRMCDGYDVAGDAEAKGKCPHQEGVCLADEETFLGMCYKKCDILTNGKYPHRKTAITCCSQASILSCVNPMNTDTSPDYAVGGGVNDGDQSTPNKPHVPMKSLTESSQST